MLVNGADVIFAVDSVPAIFAITTDTFVVYTSNIFAILGLRALYFALAAMVDRFAYLKTALAFILIFIGAKIVVADTFGLVHVPPWVSLAVTRGPARGRHRLQPVAHPRRRPNPPAGSAHGAQAVHRAREATGLHPRLEARASPLGRPGKRRDQVAQGGDGRGVGDAVDAGLAEVALEGRHHGAACGHRRCPVTGRS